MTKKIYLYGEIHGSEIVNKKELEIWNNFYSRGFRHIFMEISYFYAGFLNLWMQSENNDILDELFDGNCSGNSEFDRNFFENIKEFCPETVFHGTDIGHFYSTHGKKFLETVSADSEQYRIAEENIEQGKNFYDTWKNVSEDKAVIIREEAMVKNFIREFDSIDCDIAGFYGEAHIFSEGTGTFGIEENMLSKIKKHYGKSAEFITEFIKNGLEPIYKTQFDINGKSYSASCFGKIYTPFDEECEYIRIFRIDNPENDFKCYSEKENYIPEALYPIPIEDGNVFVIDSLKDENLLLRQYFICNGFSEEYGRITTEINVEVK